MMPKRSPRLIKNYLVGEAFAWGGMAAVHLGRALGEQGFSRVVAIKQLHPQYARDAEFVRMFLDEGRLLSRIHHSNVVTPLDVVLDQDRFLVVMEYVHGEPLSRLVGEMPMAPALACSIVLQVLAGLHAAHEARDELGRPLQLVHRDVSPQNILVGTDGNVRIADFGIARAAARARVTRDGALKGKPGYLAPEQARGDNVDRRVDIFAVGIVLWELLTGRRLFSGDGLTAVPERFLSQEWVVPSQLSAGVSLALDAVVARALATDPDQRFASAHEMAAELMSATPAATPFALSAWVESAAARELAVRARAIRELESLVLSELTVPRATSGIPQQTLPAESSRVAATTPASSTTAVEFPRGSTSARSPSKFPAGPLRRTAMAFGAALLALAALSVLGVFPPLLPVAGGSASTAVGDPEAVPGGAQPGTGNSRYDAGAGPGQLAVTVPPGQSTLASAPTETTCRDPDVPVRDRSASAHPKPRSKPLTAREQCDVPFTIGADGVKRYDAECFR